MNDTPIPLGRASDPVPSGLRVTPETAIWWAAHIARASPCAKSKRGVMIFDEGADPNDPYSPSVGLCAMAHNHPTWPFRCDGSEACRGACRDVAIHAEQAALIACAQNRIDPRGLSLLHVKVGDQPPHGWCAIPGKGPCCVPCSKLILEAQIRWIYLYELREGKGEIVRYSAVDFHRISLENCSLPVRMESP